MNEEKRSAAAARSAAVACVLLVLACAVLFDDYLRHGLDATYYYGGEAGEQIVVARTIEHRPYFPNEIRPLSRYVQGWDFERFGVPSAPPPIDVAMEGSLRVPSGRGVRLGVEGGGHVEIQVDGRAAAGGTVLEPGRHRVGIRWRAPSEGPASMRLTWGSLGSEMLPVPRRAFTPAGSNWPLARVLLWVLAPLACLLLAYGLFRSFRAAGPDVRARRLDLVVGVVLFVVAIGARAWDYDVVPDFRDNQDELSAMWNGWSMLHDGTTRGWCLWPGAYGALVQREDIRYFQSRPLPVITPYFDQPWLFHVFVGAAAHLGGAHHWSHVRLCDTRPVPIALGGLTLVLLIVLARKLDARGPAPWLAGGIYAVLPIIALQGRVLKEETLLAPMLLGGLLFFMRWRDGGERTRDLVAAAILMGACALTKTPGILFVGVLGLLLLERKRFRPAMIAVAIGALIGSVLFIHGALSNWDAFTHTLDAQATIRPSHWNLFQRYFDDPLIDHNLVGRPWLTFLWLAFFATMIARGRRTDSVLTLAPIIFIVAIALGNGRWHFGWYHLVIYPFLCIGAGRFIVDLWRRPDLLRGFVFIALFVMYFFNFATDLGFAPRPENWAEVRQDVALYCLLSLAPYVLAQALRMRATDIVARATTALGLVFSLVMSAWFIYNYESLAVTHRDFDRHGFYNR